MIWPGTGMDTGVSSDLDLLLINPSGRDAIYQELGADLTAVEPPLWCRLIAGYVRDRNYSVEIIDAEAEGCVHLRLHRG